MNISEWLDDMAQIAGVQVWDHNKGCWVWEETGSPVHQPYDEDVRRADVDAVLDYDEGV